LIPYSVLDLAPIVAGGDAAGAFRNMLDLAQHAEAWGYRRFWLAVHHNMTGIASAATAVAIGHVAGGTKTIRVGAGGVMLPNHAPLLVAEQFGTLESLYPGRIDLGLGRAPGTDQATSIALRRGLGGADTFPQDVAELQAYFEPAMPGQKVQAVPGAGLRVPIWLLGSSLFGASLAASMGLPYAFASHFAPDYLLAALELYRKEFKPSAQLQKPYAMAALNVFAAETDEEGAKLFTSVQQQFVSLRRGNPGPLQPPLDEPNWSPIEQAGVARALAYSAIGSRATVRGAIQAFLAGTQADEVILTGQIYDHEARLRSFQIAAEILQDLA
jgi:luciferase family oxidoreductase group 1